MRKADKYSKCMAFYYGDTEFHKDRFDIRRRQPGDSIFIVKASGGKSTRFFVNNLEML